MNLRRAHVVWATGVLLLARRWLYGLAAVMGSGSVSLAWDTHVLLAHEYVRRYLGAPSVPEFVGAAGSWGSYFAVLFAAVHSLHRLRPLGGGPIHRACGHSHNYRQAVEKRMSDSDPVSLLFGGMEKLGPGGNAHTLHVLRLLPTRQFRVIVDAGCGTGRQTLVLAKELGTLVHAVDSHEPFLNDLMRRAREAKVEQLVQAHCMDMKDIPRAFPNIDLLWSEGAAYNLGFADALATWASAIIPDGFAVVSELSWLKERAPDAVREFFRSGYPGMQSVRHNVAVAESAGYRLLATYTLPRQAWVDGYYDILAPRAQALLGHPEPSVRDFAAETVKEIEVFHRSEDSYGYVFYVLQRAEPGAPAVHGRHDGSPGFHG
jgi:SAM-dependent methyltransferase